MKDKKPLDWFPMFVDKWLFGSTRLELEPDERSVWVDLMALCQKDKGFIRANESVPYPSQQLAGLFCVTVELLERTINKCLTKEVGKIKKLEDGTLYIINWKEYAFSERHKRRLIKENNNKDSILYNRGSQKEDTMADLTDTEKEIIKLLGEIPLFPKNHLQTLNYLRALKIEFSKVDELELIKEKCAWWLKKPLKKDSNPYLQLRNWFRIAAGKSSYQQGQARVGAKGKEIKRKTPDDFPDHDMIFVKEVHEIARKDYAHLWNGEPARFADDAIRYWEAIKKNFKELGETAEAFVSLIAIEWDSNNKREEK